MPHLLWLTMVLIALAAGFDRAHLLRLFWRARWLFLSIVVLFGWFTPGTAVLPYAVGWMPTYEGLAWAAEHVLRLAFMVAWLVCWYHWLPAAEQPLALYRALHWLTYLGIPIERFVVRLSLVLTALDAPPSRPLRSLAELRAWLHEEGRKASQPLRAGGE